jgi:ribosomal protein L18E
VLTRSRFRVAAGRTKRVVVRFSRAARRRIRRAGGVSLRVRTRSAGKTYERTLSVRLKGGAR